MGSISGNRVCVFGLWGLKYESIFCSLGTLDRFNLQIIEMN